MKTCLTLFLVAGALLLGATPARVGAASTHGPMGLVPHAGVRSAARLAASMATAQGPLVYHNGSVMRTNTVYAIYWMPTASLCGGACSSYESAIDQYFGDVAAASGSSSNVYSAATQYYDTTGPISYQSSFGGSYVDSSTPFPANGCNDTYRGLSDVHCLTDAQLRTEIQSVVAHEGWPTGVGNLFFILTPSTVGICIDSQGVSGQGCSTNVFCAYHDSFTGSGGSTLVYAAEPDNATIPTAGCNSGEAPNGTADPTINTISHEHNEAITDPTSGGWWVDSSGDENGDLCAWEFGSYQGTPGLEYNQTINGHHYFLQQEYSNANAGCVQSYIASSAPSNSAPPIVSGVAAVGQALTTSNGSWSGSPTSYAFQWQSCSSSGTSCADISGATGATYTPAAGDAGHEIRSEVSATNSGGSSGYVASTPTEVVVPVPAVTAGPVVSGVAAVGRTLSTTQGTWNTPVTYAYQWLQCSSTGTACSSIPGATASTYNVVPTDRGHELEARVSATNASTTTTALSAPTAPVVGLPAASRLLRISGTAKVGRRLSIGAGSWSGSPTSFRYQWLRCGAGGGSCGRIKGATKTTYRLTKRDARHRLRVRITAVNAAGRSSSTSAATRTVKS